MPQTYNKDLNFRCSLTVRVTTRVYLNDSTQHPSQANSSSLRVIKNATATLIAHPKEQSNSRPTRKLRERLAKTVLKTRTEEASQEKRLAGWNDLPHEMLVHIAKELIVLQHVDYRGHFPPVHRF